MSGVSFCLFWMGWMGGVWLLCLWGTFPPLEQARMGEWLVFGELLFFLLFFPKLSHSRRRELGLALLFLSLPLWWMSRPFFVSPLTFGKMGMLFFAFLGILLLLDFAQMSFSQKSFFLFYRFFFFLSFGLPFLALSYSLLSSSDFPSWGYASPFVFFYGLLYDRVQSWVGVVFLGGMGGGLFLQRKVLCFFEKRIE